MTRTRQLIYGVFSLVIIICVGFIVAIATDDIGNAFLSALTAALVFTTIYYAIITNRIFEINREAIKVAKDTSLAQIIIQLTTAYAQPEMLAGMLNLRNFKERFEENFAGVFGQLEGSDPDYFKRLNEDRRRFSHHFSTIFLLLDTGVIDIEFLKKLVRPGTDDQIDFLLEVIEPLEKEINPSYDPRMFVRFQEIYQKKSSVVRETSS